MKNRKIVPAFFQVYENDCLRDYYNQEFHSVLDWRLAFDMARLSQQSGSEISFNIVYWKKFIEKIATKVAQKYKGTVSNIESGLYLIESKNKRCLLTHPFGVRNTWKL